MKVEGTVVGLKDGRAVVRVAAGQSCSLGCRACSALASCGQELEALAAEPVEVGASVVVEIPSAGAVVSTLLIFVLPLLGLVGGVVLGQELRPQSGNAIGLAIGFGLFVVLFAVAYFVDRRLVQPRMPEPKIVKTLDKGARARR
jgi:positive regulator of sigma E activity